eukprot:Em0021g767a
MMMKLEEDMDKLKEKLEREKEELKRQKEKLERQKEELKGENDELMQAGNNEAIVQTIAEKEKQLTTIMILQEEQMRKEILLEEQMKMIRKQLAEMGMKEILLDSPFKKPKERVGSSVLQHRTQLQQPRGEESTYCPMPLMISSKAYGLQMDTFVRTVFDLAKTAPNLMLLQQESNGLDVIFFMGVTPRDTFSMLIEKNGKSLIPPPWMVSTVKERVICTSNMTSQHLSINPVHFFPDESQRGQEDFLKVKNHTKTVKGENEELLSLGVKVLCYFNPMLDSSYTELYNTAAENGYLTKAEDGLPYNFSYIGTKSFRVSQVDFSNPAAVQWYQEQLNEAVMLNFSGWMYDYGEYTPPYSVSYDGSSGLDMHNRFALLYQKTACDYMSRLDPDPSDAYAPDYMFYVRSYASGLPAQVVASLNIGLSGMPYSGSDISGFEWYVDPVPDLELWARWTAVGSVSGQMHEEGEGHGSGAKTNIFKLPNGTSIWRKFVKLRTQLFPYIYTQAHIAHETGLPIMRHHLLTFWNDSLAIQQCYQYMFGDSFLAAPVVNQGATKWEVYLPTYGDGLGPLWLDVGSTFQYDSADGRYRIGFSDYYTGGQTVTVESPIDNVPLFVMAGSIIPVLDPRVLTLNNATNSSVTTWWDLKDRRNAWIFADKDFSADGWTWDGLAYSLQRSLDGSVEFTVKGAPTNSTHILQIAGPWSAYGVPGDVTSEGSDLPLQTSWEDVLASGGPGYYYDQAQMVLWIKLTETDSASVTLNSV